MKRLVCVALVALAFAPVASAASSGEKPHPTLDAVASDIAGHHAHVWCEDNEYDWWEAMERLGNEPALTELYGFVLRDDRATAYLSPRICLALHQALASGYRSLDPTQFVLALFTLVHESMHLRGHDDEAVANCLTLQVLGRVAVTHFGFRRLERYSSARRVRRLVRVSVKRGPRRALVLRPAYRYVRAYRSRTDRDFELLLRLAWEVHRNSPAHYQTAC